MQILINTIIDRLHLYQGFLMSLVESFIQISKIKEPTYSKSNKNRINYADNLPELNEGPLPAVSKYLTRKCVEAKAQALEYLKKVLSTNMEVKNRIFFDQQLFANYNPKIDLLKLAMFYVLNTEAYKVCEKTTEILQMVLEREEHAFSLISNIDKAKGCIINPPFINFKVSICSSMELMSSKKQSTQILKNTTTGGAATEKERSVRPDREPSISFHPPAQNEI